MLLKVPAADQYRHKLVPALGLTMYITALVAEFCNLDQAADEDEEVRADLEKIIQGVSDREQLPVANACLSLQLIGSLDCISTCTTCTASFGN
jgi:hypothetical protein